MAMGVDKISSEIEPANVESALKVFPQIPCLQSVRQPSGKVDLLIGLNYLEVQPWEVARKGGLSLLESRFGTGYLLGGTHPEIWGGDGTEMLVSHALQISRSTNHASYKVSHHAQLSKDKNFLEAEELGVGQPRRGDTCKHRQVQPQGRAHDQEGIRRVGDD